MKQKYLSALLVFLLITSATIPAVSAEPSHVYYELHDMCICNAKEDLGRIPGCWGIGYEAWIDKQTDNWEIFVHAGFATKKFIITPETDLGKLVALRDFVNNVNECKKESDQLPVDLFAATIAGLGGSWATMKGILTDNAVITMPGVMSLGASATEIHQFVIHFNNAKTAQKNAERLIDIL